MTESRQKRKGLETMQVRLFTAQPAGGAAAWDELKKETRVCVRGGTRFSASEVFTFRCWCGVALAFLSLKSSPFAVDATIDMVTGLF